jgi:NADH-quinone oxidoreductase subunit H
VFTLLFLGGWNPLPWISLADFIGWAHGVFGSPYWTHPLVVGLLSISIFLGKVIFGILFFMWVRWTVPRFRYDQVMELGWKKLLPLAIGNLIFYMIAIAVIETK